MEFIIGVIFCCIINIDFFCVVYKFVIFIFDGIVWKEGYNGLLYGIVVFILGDFVEWMEVFR